jgi:hypothetical protein
MEQVHRVGAQQLCRSGADSAHGQITRRTRQERLYPALLHLKKEGFELGTRLLVFDKVRLDPQTPGRFGATITYDIPLGVAGKKLFDELATTTQRTEPFVDNLAPA